MFSISKYAKDRHTQRSKSFATIREFSNNDRRADAGVARNHSVLDNNNNNTLSSIDSKNSSNNNKSNNYENINNNKILGSITNKYNNNNNNSNNNNSNNIAINNKNYNSNNNNNSNNNPLDVNNQDAVGNSFLHHASSKGDICTIKYLLSQGGDVWVKNHDQSLPLDLALNFQTAKLLSSATLFYGEQNNIRMDKNIMQTAKLNTAL